VLASEDFARGRGRAVWVLGSAAASDSMLLGDKRDLSRVMATERAAKAAYQQRARAVRRPRGRAARLLHDRRDRRHRRLGFFEPGAGGLAAEKGMTTLGGKIPVNTSAA